MTEQESGFAPTDPSVEDDLLAPAPSEGAAAGREGDEGKEPAEAREDLEREPDEEADEAEEQVRPRSPQRQFVRIGWALVAVLVIIGALTVVELVRISNAVNNNGCILKAQANFMQAQGPGVTPGFAGLDRLVGQNQLKKCSQ